MTDQADLRTLVREEFQRRLERAERACNELGKRLSKALNDNQGLKGKVTSLTRERAELREQVITLLGRLAIATLEPLPPLEAQS